MGSPGLGNSGGLAEDDDNVSQAMSEMNMDDPVDAVGGGAGSAERSSSLARERASKERSAKEGAAKMRASLGGAGGSVGSAGGGSGRGSAGGVSGITRSSAGGSSRGGSAGGGVITKKKVTAPPSKKAR